MGDKVTPRFVKEQEMLDHQLVGYRRGAARPFQAAQPLLELEGRLYSTESPTWRLADLTPITHFGAYQEVAPTPVAEGFLLWLMEEDYRRACEGLGYVFYKWGEAPGGLSTRLGTLPQLTAYCSSLLGSAVGRLHLGDRSAYPVLRDLPVVEHPLMKLTAEAFHHLCTRNPEGVQAALARAREAGLEEAFLQQLQREPLLRFRHALTLDEALGD